MFFIAERQKKKTIHDTSLESLMFRIILILIILWNNINNGTSKNIELIK